MSSNFHAGNVTIYGPDIPTQEFDCYICCHCNAQIIVQRSGDTALWSPPEKIAVIGEAPTAAQQAARHKRRRGFCFRCMGPTCGREKCLKCVPFEAQLEAMEGSRRFWKDIRLA